MQNKDIFKYKGIIVVIFIMIFCIAFGAPAQAKKKKSKHPTPTPTMTEEVQADAVSTTQTPQVQPTAPAGVEQGKTASYYYDEGLRYEKNMDYKKAYINFYTAVTMDKTYYNAYRKLGNIYFTAKNYKYAVYFYEKYLVYKPNDTELRKFVESLKSKAATPKSKATATGGPPILPEQQGPMLYEFKSPSTAFMMSGFDLISCPLLSGYGSFYARTRGQDFFPGPANISMVSDFIMIFGGGTYLLLQSSGNAKDLSPFYPAANLCAVMTSSALLFDFASAPFMATENSEKFINYIKTHNINVPKIPVEYKDPLLSASLSLVAGNIVPGIGHFYCGDTDQGLKLLLMTYGMNSVLTGAGFFVVQQQHLAGEIIFGLDALVYSILRFTDIQGSAAETDGINEQYYEQKLCPNSPLKKIEIKDEKSTALAFGIALVPGALVHGAGNFYAENYITAFTLAGWELAGGIMYLAANGTDSNKTMDIQGSGVMVPSNSEGWVKYTGLGLFALSYLYDIVSAPGYTAIYNAVYTNKLAQATPIKAALMPYFDKNEAGLQFAYSF